MDKFLDLVERGCWDALAKQYLRSVIVDIFTDKHNRQSVTESYQLTFSYPDRQENPFLTTFSINQNEKSLVQVENQADLAKAINQMVRQLCRQIQQLPMLPRTNNL